MIRQYNAQTFRALTLTNRATGRVHQARVGTVPVGTIVALPDSRGRAQRHSAVEVLAWMNRELGAGRRVNDRYESTFHVGGHLALVRELKTGATRLLADHILRHAVEVCGERVPRTRQPVSALPARPRQGERAHALRAQLARASQRRAA